MAEPARGLLEVVATPIGNLGDLSPRAAQALRDADVVLCEDTRHSAPLLAAAGSSARTLSLHAHNEEGRIPQVLALLVEGKRVALVSDAGTPCLSDPGARLVDAAHDAGLPVRTLPGPFAVAAGLAASGLCPLPFAFWGFLPKKSAARQAMLRERLAPSPGGGAMSHAFYAPGRDLREVLGDVAAVAPAARVVVARELSKLHETYHRGRADVLASSYPEDALRGEAVVLVEVAEGLAEVGAFDLDGALREAAASADRKEALRALARQTGRSRRELYARMLTLIGES
ncbi:MAG: hypothetical protein RIT45_588 [Pseudomonadota bacterium]